MRGATTLLFATAWMTGHFGCGETQGPPRDAAPVVFGTLSVRGGLAEATWRESGVGGLLFRIEGPGGYAREAYVPLVASVTRDDLHMPAITQAQAGLTLLAPVGRHHVTAFPMAEPGRRAASCAPSVRLVDVGATGARDRLFPVECTGPGNAVPPHS
jgi:hypothetical protein